MLALQRRPSVTNQTAYHHVSRKHQFARRPQRSEPAAAQGAVCRGARGPRGPAERPRRPLRPQLRNGRGHRGPALRLQFARRPHRLRRVAPELRPQDAHRPPPRLHRPRRLRRRVGLFGAGRERARQLCDRPHVDGRQPCLRPGQGARPAGRLRERHCRAGRRLAQRRRGFRGAQQCGRTGHQFHRPVQRQSDVDCREPRRHVCRPGRAAPYRRTVALQPLPRPGPRLPLRGRRQRPRRAHQRADRGARH